MCAAPLTSRSCGAHCRRTSLRSRSVPIAITSPRWTTMPTRSSQEAWISFVHTAMRERNDRMDDEEIPPQARERRSGNDAGGTVGRDVGRDEGRDQATWRDLVARLELPT